MFVYALLVLLPALALSQPSNLDQLEAKLFGALDANKDGKITEGETETYFLTFDTDKNNEISKTEFTTAVDKLDPAFKAHEDVLFQLFNRDNTGDVNKADIDTVFGIADIDKDKEVSKIEFHIIFTLVLNDVHGGGR